ncbi:PREDICTED: odorant receptor 82a-like isoform X2 [Dinoponera quadriceps]|uniref:Odorant receptor n=1 Tax=Dinoponera quadriceps TaxID=609295 RepID=A0A6P3YF67_DINQU|nr:PREDICTED: odorant receptor 82a-like isoform X2 [Dinoponera quadriceps]
MRLRLETFYDEQVLSWSKLLLSILGLWPESHDNLKFFFFATYIICVTALLIVNLLQNMHDAERIMRNITFSFPSVLIVLKNLMFRWKMNQLSSVLEAVRKNVGEGLYQSPAEKCKVIWYNVASTLFATSSATSLFFVPTLYYTIPILSCILSSSGNCTLPYELPARVNLVYEISEMRSYALFCAILMPSSTLLTIGATAADSLLVSLTFYLCGQLSILGHHVKNTDPRSLKYHYEMKVLMVRHAELLRLASILADTFSSLMFVQTMGLIFSLCIVAYQLLMNVESGKGLNEIIHFMIYSAAVVLLAFCYCFLGECLISESVALDWACYSTNWHELPIESVRLLMICIARSRKPLCLTAGKFYIFSLETFGTIMKASMAYLSVLRTIT